MNDHMSIEEVSDQLHDLVGTAILSSLPARQIASALLKTTVILAAACEINPDDLMADLSDFAIEMDNNHHRSHLH